MEGKLVHLVFILSTFIRVLDAGCSGGGKFSNEDTICGLIKNPDGVCKPQDSPYKPGGNTIHLEPIVAPVATIQENGLANMGKYAGLGVEVGESVLDVAEAAEKGFQSAKKLAAHLSVWGTVFGALATGTPSAQDILDSVNKAFVDLTNDINDAFADMKGYVDQQILESQKDRWNDEFSFYYNTFTGCLDYYVVGDEKVNECMEGVEDPSRNDKNVFMDYWSKMETDWDPSPEDVRHMEVQFLVFRDYVNLRVMILLTLINTYQNLTDDYHQKMTQLYYKHLVEETDLYIKYAIFCYDHIKEKHNTQHDWFVNSQKCFNFHKVCEGWPGAHTGSEMDCQMRFSRMLLASEYCQATSFVRVDGARPPKYQCNSYESWGTHSEEEAIGFITHMGMESWYYEFNSNMQKQIKNYWEPSIMDTLPKLKQIHDEAKKVMDEKYPTQLAISADEYMTKGRKDFITMIATTIAQRKLDRKEMNRPSYLKIQRKAEL